MEWISVEDALPTCSEVLVVKHFLDAEFDFEKGGYNENKTFKNPSHVTIDRFFGDNFHRGGVVTHWMLLPEPPKENDGMD